MSTNPASPPRHLWPLMALACAPDGVLSPVQMQKALFLVGMEAKEQVGEEFYQFVPHHYGPFSAGIYQDNDTLAGKGRIAKIPNDSRNWDSYGLTECGKAEGQKGIALLDAKTATYLKEVVNWVASQEFLDLLREIYKAYPDYARNSVFRGTL